MKLSDWIMGALVMIALILLPVALALLLMAAPIVIVVLSPAAGPWLIRQVVCEVNRRHDPRHAKRPPDPP